MLKIGPDEKVRFMSLNDPRGQEYLSGREATGDELSKHQAGETLVNLARAHMKRKGGTFSEALRAIAPIVPGELKDYLGYQLPDSTRLLPRGVKKVTEMEFMKSMGWTEEGVEDWLKTQGFMGGTLIAIRGGWSYSPDPSQNAFPR